MNHNAHRIIGLHVLATRNLGDRMCAPYHYFPLSCTPATLATREVPEAAYIIGGGGLMHPFFSKDIRRHVEAANGPVIAWGIGTNTHGLLEADPPDWLSGCSLLGIRDYGSSFPWVPCASCMSPEFDREEPPKFEAVVYRHHKEKDNIPDRMALPTLTNYAKSFNDVISFLLSGEYVITNTYHGMYWATLLKRKVIVYPFSSRHHYLRHRPTLIEDGSHWREAMTDTRVYHDALSDCRAANLDFFDKVKRVLNL